MKISIGRMSLSGTLPYNKANMRIKTKEQLASTKTSTYLASSLVQPQVVSEFLLAHGTRCVDLVTEDEERNFGKLLDGKQSVQFCLGLGEPLKVGTVDQEDDAIHFREIVAPKSARCRSKGGQSVL